jgi:hypothetical protein
VEKYIREISKGNTKPSFIKDVFGNFKVKADIIFNILPEMTSAEDWDEIVNPIIKKIEAFSKQEVLDCDLIKIVYEPFTQLDRIESKMDIK